MIKDIIHEYGKQNYDKFNNEIIYEKRQESLVEYILDIADSIVASPFCNKVVGWHLETDENQFDSTKVIYPNRKKEKKKTKGDLTIPIEASRLEKMTIIYELEYEGEIDYLEQILYLPKVKDKFYYHINGNRCYPLYQIVDNSTYSRDNSLTLKSVRTRIVIERDYTTMEDIYGTTFKVVTFISKLFNKQCNMLLYFLAGRGFYETIRFMDMEDVVEITDTISNVGENYYFEVLDGGVYIQVNKFIFTQDEFTRSFVHMLHNLMSYDKKKRKRDLIEYRSTEYWVTRLGAVFTNNVDDKFVYNKGLGVLVSFNRFCDKSSQRTLKLDPHNKSDTYALVRWMIRNFTALEQKNNLDLSTKRIRLAEYLANYYAQKVSAGIYRLLDTSKKHLTLKRIKSAIAVTPDIIINQIQKSPLIRFDNNVNDMDLFMSLKYSLKGPSGLGENNPNSVPSIYRRAHPSHVKYRLDINSSGTSDPGMSGVLTPMAKPVNGYFDPTPEVQDYEHNLQRLKMVYASMQHQLSVNEINRVIGDALEYDDDGYIVIRPMDDKDTIDEVELAKLFVDLKDKATKYEFEVIEGLLDDKDVLIMKDENGRIDPVIHVLGNSNGEYMEMFQVL